MKFNYNPSGLSTNCGFCAISRALHVTRDQKTDADQLYKATIKRLGVERKDGSDPLPRMLVFPERSWDGINISTPYAALSQVGRGLADYTITRVATDNKLNIDPQLKADLLNSFLNYYSGRGHGAWSMKDFLEYRLDYLQEQGRNPSPELVEAHLRSQLCGDSIIGSKSVSHYVNLHIDQAGIITAYDAQVDKFYDGKGLKGRLCQIDLFMPVK